MTDAIKTKVLLLEDRYEDVELINREINKHNMNMDILHVVDKKGFIESLTTYKPDLILSDYSLPSFNGLDALQIVISNKLDIPFIIVTGSINEETAVECIKKGATDYVIKENLNRLIPAINNAFEIFESKRQSLEAQKALLETEAKFSHAFNYANIGMCLIDLEGNFIQTNSRFCDLCGYTNTELLKKSVYEITHPDDIKTTKEFYSEFITGGNERAELETKYLHKNGRIVWVFISISLVRNNGGKEDFFVSHIQDITQKKKDEENIRKLSKSVEQSPVMVIITDLEGKIEYVNPKAEEVTGFKAEELMNKTSSILMSGNQGKSFDEQLWNTIKKGEVWKGEFLNKKKNGELYWESATISVINDSNDKPTHYIAIKQDISEQKLLEERLIEAKEKAEESDRLKTAFLANVSHEIRTPMNGILGFSSLLDSEDLTNELRHNYIQIIKKSGDQLLNIVNDILDISLIAAGQIRIDKEIFKINILLQELHTIFSNLLKVKNKKIEILQEIPSCEDYYIKTDRKRLNQILTNLLSNAEKFTKSGKIIFGVEVFEDKMYFYVKDTGIGIHAEYLNSIFDRFRQENETISKDYGGAGLGLSITKSLVELLGGEIEVESQPNVGSTFSFFIPRKIKRKKLHE